MVAIKNDTSKNINFVNSTLHSEKTNELFAELFALINTNSLDPENKNLLKDVVLQKTDTEEFLDVNKNISENSLLKVTSEQKNKLEVTDSEYETAKSLIEVFYKEIGIVEPLNQTKNANPNSLNQNPKSLLNKNFITGEKKIAVENKLDSGESDLAFISVSIPFSKTFKLGIPILFLSIMNLKMLLILKLDLFDKIPISRTLNFSISPISSLASS